MISYPPQNTICYLVEGPTVTKVRVAKRWTDKVAYTAPRPNATVRVIEQLWPGGFNRAPDDKIVVDDWWELIPEGPEWQHQAVIIQFDHPKE